MPDSIESAVKTFILNEFLNFNLKIGYIIDFINRKNH